jgi:hypothetical protein
MNAVAPKPIRASPPRRPRKGGIGPRKRVPPKAREGVSPPGGMKSGLTKEEAAALKEAWYELELTKGDWSKSR